MRVFVVLDQREAQAVHPAYWGRGQPGVIIGVYRTRETAERAARSHLGNSPFRETAWRIEEWSLEG